jgi:ribulose bisphosphate carboxylase small subunit
MAKRTNNDLQMSMNEELEDQQSLSQIYNVLHNSFDLTSDHQAVSCYENISGEYDHYLFSGDRSI